jgi:hypothetical protein
LCSQPIGLIIYTTETSPVWNLKNSFKKNLEAAYIFKNNSKQKKKFKDVKIHPNKVNLKMKKEALKKITKENPSFQCFVTKKSFKC